MVVGPNGLPCQPRGITAFTTYPWCVTALPLSLGAHVACSGAVLWAVVNELLIQPREYSAFSLSLERLRDDPRIAVTLGTPVSGYGQVCCLSEPQYGALVPPGSAQMHST